MSFQGKWRVAMVEDNPLTRRRFADALQASPDFELAFAAETLVEILAWLESHEPAVLLVDLKLPDGDGIEAIKSCARRYPGTEIMVISMFGEEDRVIESLEAGATGYLLKDGTESNLAAHLAQLRAGGSPMSPIIARQLIKRVRPAADAAQTATAAANALTPRELEILDLISRGFNYREIAEIKGIVLSTVQSHIRSIYTKLSVHSKTEAVYEAGRQGLLRPPTSAR